MYVRVAEMTPSRPTISKHIPVRLEKFTARMYDLLD
jgi:hypothetical protein